MPYYRAGVVQDATIRLDTVIEADDPQLAADAAYRAWESGDRKVPFEHNSTSEHDSADPFEVEEIEEITEEVYRAELARLAAPEVEMVRVPKETVEAAVKWIEALVSYQPKIAFAAEALDAAKKLRELST